MQLYAPAITRVQLNGVRYYKVEGYEELFPSVTTVLSVIAKPALVPWARNVALNQVRASLTERVGGAAWITPEWIEDLIAEAKQRPDQVRDEAADFGTQAHILIDAIIRGERPPVPPEMEPVVASFEAWRKEAGLDIQLTETMVFSPTHRYAGAMDALAWRAGGGQRLVALDWKTSNSLHPEYALQVAAYARAMEEMSGQKVHEAWVVRFGKTAPEFEARRVQDLDAAFDAFRAALTLWRSLRQPLM